MNKINKILIVFSLAFGLFIGFGACERDYIDYGQLDTDELNARENYLSQNYNTIRLTEDDRTFTALLINREGGVIDTIKPTLSGLYVIIETSVEDGITPTLGRLVKVNYTGRLLDGTEFDSGTDFNFTYGNNEVIVGWDEAIGYMKKGETATLIIPSNIAYQYAERTDADGNVVIPRASTLIFNIELINAQK